MPTRQRLHAVRLAHAAAELARERRVWARADVQTPSGWARRECTRRAEEAPAKWPRILTAAEEWWLWRRAAREAAHEAPFLDSALLGESLRRSSERAAEYGIRFDHGVRGGGEAQLLERAQQLFEASCRDLTAASVSELTPRLLEAPEARAFLLRGFDAVSPRLAALAAARGGATPEASAPVATPHRVLTEDADSQMEAIAAWCCARLAARSDARLLVMLPGPAGVRARLAALIRGGLDPAAALAGSEDAAAHVAIEGGEPLGALPLPSQALVSLAVLGGAEADSDEISRWLTAPYWESPAAPARAALALLVRESRVARLGLRELLATLQSAPRAHRAAARELALRVQRAARRLQEPGASPRRWSERFDAALGVLGWPGSLPAGSGVHQTRLRWRKLLDEFGELAASTGMLAREPALELLRALALHTRHHCADEDVAVTISPVLADPVVRYDGIWVGALSAGALPEAVAADPFLPFAAQLAAGLPEASARGRRAQAAALLSGWSRGSAELLLSVPERDGDLRLLPSPCLAGLALTQEQPPALWLPKRLHRSGALESLEDATGAVFGTQKALGGTRALTLQNSCPFRAYAELRLGAAPPELPQPGVPPDKRGLLLHTALQLLWNRLRDSRGLQALDAGALDALIADCVEQGVPGLRAESARAGRGATGAASPMGSSSSSRSCRRCSRANARGRGVSSARCATSSASARRSASRRPSSTPSSSSAPRG